MALSFVLDEVTEGYLAKVKDEKQAPPAAKKAKRINIYFFFFFSFSCSNMLIFSEERHPPLT
jgi:hypothetical protein